MKRWRDYIYYSGLSILVVSIVVNIVLYNIYINNNIHVLEDIPKKDITKVVTIKPTVKIDKQENSVASSNLNIKIDPIHVYQDKKGNVSVPKEVKGKATVNNEVFDLSLKLDTSIRFSKRQIPLRIAYLYQTPLNGAVSTEYGTLSALYPLVIPFTSLKIHLGVGIRGFYLTFPRHITNNLTADMGVGKDWKGKTQIVAGVSLKL